MSKMKKTEMKEKVTEYREAVWVIFCEEIKLMGNSKEATQLGKIVTECNKFIRDEY